MILAGLMMAGCKESTLPDITYPPDSYLQTRSSWSPDGKTIAYRDETDGKAGLYLVDSSGANIRQLVSGEGVGCAWSPDSKKLSYSATGYIYTIRATGDSVTKITAGGTDIRPAWSPDGGQIAFVRTGIWLVRLGDLSVRQLTYSGNFPCWHPNGGELVVMDQLQVTGSLQFQYYVDAFDTSTALSRSLYSFISAALCGFGQISPDGKRYAMRVQAVGERSQIWLVDLTTTGATMLTDDGGDYPAWSPDGGRIVYTRTAEGDGTLWVMGADGSGKRKLTQ
jgi:TolB protein